MNNSESTSVSDVTQSPTNSSEEEIWDDLDDDLDDGDDNDDLTHHTIPFKVMGVAYSAELQKHLENAFQILHERTVKAKSVPESEMFMTRTLLLSCWTMDITG